MRATATRRALPAARALAVYEIDGTADTAIPYGGGPLLGHGVVIAYGRCRQKVHVTRRALIGGVHRWGSVIGALVTANLPAA